MVEAKIREVKADAAVITEAELPPGEAPNLAGYDTFLPNISKSRRARVVVFVRKALHAEQLPSPVDVPIVAVRSGTSSLIGIYRQFALPTNQTKADTVRGLRFEGEQLDAIIQLIQDVSDRSKAMYVTGDLNLDLARKEDGSYYRGALLDRWLGEVSLLGLEWAKTGPTFLSDGLYDGNRREATIDHMYSRSHDDFHAETMDDALSDHLPVLATLRDCGLETSGKLKRRERDWKLMDSEALCLGLLDNDWADFLNLSSADEAVSVLQNAIIKALNVAVPIREYETPNYKVRLQPDTRAAIRARNEARKNGALHFKHLRNKALSLVRRDYVVNNVAKIKKGGQAAAWRIVADACGKGRTGGLPLPEGCMNDEEASNQCNQFYIEKIRKLRDNLKKEADVENDTNLSVVNAVKARDSEFQFCCIGTKDIKKAISQLSAKNAVGVDDIPVTVYKAAISVLALPLTHVINLIIEERQWPDTWKEAIIIPVLKAGKPKSDIGSFRPVSLLCAISKIAERVLFNQMYEFIEANSILPPEQHGFRSGRGVDTALASMLTRAAGYLDAGKKVTVAAFDYSAAFDTVEPEVLLSKTAWLGDAAKSLLRSYLTGRRQRVRWNEESSSLLEVEYGVPQGSVLGPLLFVILTSDLPAIVRSTTAMASSELGPTSVRDAAASVRDTRVPSLDVEVDCGLYADDTSCLVASRSWVTNGEAVEAAADCIARYSRRNGLHLNPSKTQTLKIAPDTPASYTLDLLGISLNKNLSFGAHHKKLLADLRRRIGVIRRLRTRLSRGPLLCEIANALVIGKVQSCAWITRRIRVERSQGPSQVSVEDTGIQVALNDLSRELLGIRRKDRVKVTDLANRTGIPTLNEIATKQAAVAAWRAVNVEAGALENVLVPFDGRTRGATGGLRRPASTRSIAAMNLSTAWNWCEDLRTAATLSGARAAAKKLAFEARWA